MPLTEPPALAALLPLRGTTIDDNGKGFEGRASVNDNGRGLGNISYRAETLGGTATWSLRTPEPGTRFCLSLPLQHLG